jgi:hypothetical protein
VKRRGGHMKKRKVMEKRKKNSDLTPYSIHTQTTRLRDSSGSKRLFFPVANPFLPTPLENSKFIRIFNGFIIIFKI